MNLVSIWVRMSRMSMHYWYEEHFINIGNIIGTFIVVYLSFKETKLLRVARILVNINIREGLAKDMMLNWGWY